MVYNCVYYCDTYLVDGRDAAELLFLCESVMPRLQLLRRYRVRKGVV
jgi:hypothetical protein